MKDVDITKVSLSKPELRKLKFIAKSELIERKLFDQDEVISRLSNRGLIEFTCSDKFGYDHIEGILGVMPNSISLSDAGQQYLNRTTSLTKKERIEWVRYLVTTAIALAAFIKSFFF